MYKDNKYYHTFSEILDFSEDTQKAVDEIIIFINNFYIKNTQTTIKIIEYNNDFTSLENRHAEEYFKYAFNLLFNGLHEEVVEILLQNKYEYILQNYNKKDIETLRIQLLIVKKSSLLLLNHKFNNYSDFFNQLISDNTDTSNHYYYFQKLKNK